METLTTYIQSLPRGTELSAAAICAQTGAKLNRKLMLALRDLREKNLLILVGIAQYKVA